MYKLTKCSYICIFEFVILYGVCQIHLSGQFLLAFSWQGRNCSANYFRLSLEQVCQEQACQEEVCQEEVCQEQACQEEVCQEQDELDDVSKVCSFRIYDVLELGNT